MKIKSGILFGVLLSLFLVFAGLNNAEAKRFGGGGNFGGRSSYSSPYQRSAQPSRPINQQQQTDRQSPAANPAFSKRSGLMGMLGGLALGGLLGSMFMGGGFHGINFMDILVFGGIAFLLFKLLAARNASAQRPSYGQPASGNSYQDSAHDYNAPQSNSAGFDTDILFNKDKKENRFSNPNAGADADFGSATVVPKDFDENSFLSGAKIAYKTLQKAWDERDLAGIRSLTTDKVFAEIQHQLNSTNEANRTDVLKVDAELLEVREIGNEIEAVVLFDSIIREADDAQAGQIREVWHFVKSNNPNVTKWLLDGIQQLAE